MDPFGPLPGRLLALFADRWVKLLALGFSPADAELKQIISPFRDVFGVAGIVIVQDSFFGYDNLRSDVSI